ERFLVVPRFDHLAQPPGARVAADVLDLVGNRAAIRLLQLRVCLGEGAPGHVDPQQVGRDAGHDLGVSPSGPGSSAGSPGGSEPSGSRRAARWPKWRMAFTRAMAAATCFNSSGGGKREVGGVGSAAATAPVSRLPPPDRPRLSNTRS